MGIFCWGLSVYCAAHAAKGSERLTGYIGCAVNAATSSECKKIRNMDVLDEARRTAGVSPDAAEKLLYSRMAIPCMCSVHRCVRICFARSSALSLETTVYPAVPGYVWCNVCGLVFAVCRHT